MGSALLVFPFASGSDMILPGTAEGFYIFFLELKEIPALCSLRWPQHSLHERPSLGQPSAPEAGLYLLVGVRQIEILRVPA